ncbi:MAG: hemolysin family protein [Wenzhouxiangella sp.]|jgi:CBS domain containing-hemolysin-like protein|nr:hemolysin family protein [Wenzhouxiangella sp.]
MTLLLFYLFLAIGVSFLCSILEAALLSITPAHMAVLNERGGRVGKHLRELKRDVDRPLAAILSLNTIAHTFGAAGVGAQAQVLFGSAYVTISSALITLAILIFSEIIPKTLGATYWKKLTPFTVWGCLVLIWIMLPLVWLSKQITRLLSRGKPTSSVSREEFRALAQIGTREGVFEKDESNIFLNVIRFGAIRVQDIMTPRVVVKKFRSEMRLAEMLEGDDDLVFSRYPIYGDNDEDIQGYVLKSDVIMALIRGQGEQTLFDLKREVLFVPEFISLRVLFGQLLAEQEHFAVVVDEYGGFSGVVTMEDVLETLLGIEIVDESDAVEDLRKAARDKWTRRAKKLGLELPDPLAADGPETPGGARS